MNSLPLDKTCLFSTPKIRPIEGPVISPSRIAILYPSLCLASANNEVTEDFPTPPLPLTTPITFFT